ncbi:B-box zinc finger protein, putative, partial [Eimeria tenella]
KKALRMHTTNAAYIKEAFESVIRALDLRCEATEREMDLEKTLSAQSLKALDGDCQVMLRYLNAKALQLQQLQQLGSSSSVACSSIGPTFEALEEKTDLLPDMRERLRVPHWKLRVLEMDSLLSERQNALLDLSNRVGLFCEKITAAANSFLALQLPLQGPPAQHREVDALQQQLLLQQQQQQQEEEQPPVIYNKGLNPYGELFLKKRFTDAAASAALSAAPDKYQAFVRKDPLHLEWEVRVVSLRGPYLCVHASEEDPFAAVETALFLDSSCYARTFAAAAASALAAAAAADYPHGLEVLDVDIHRKELRSFLLLAADGEALAAEWVAAIEELCMQNCGAPHPTTPGYDPSSSPQQLHLEAANLNFPVACRRKAALLPAELQGEQQQQEGSSAYSSSSSSRSDSARSSRVPSSRSSSSSSSSRYGRDRDSASQRSFPRERHRSSRSSRSSKREKRETSGSRSRSNSSRSGSEASSDEAAAAAAAAALEALTSPQRPIFRREETNELESKTFQLGALYERRMRRAAHRAHSPAAAAAAAAAGSSSRRRPDAADRRSRQPQPPPAEPPQRAAAAKPEAAAAAAAPAAAAPASAAAAAESETEDANPSLKTMRTGIRQQAVLSRIKAFEAKAGGTATAAAAAPPVKLQQQQQHSSSPPHSTFRSLPEIDTLDFALVPETQLTYCSRSSRGSRKISSRSSRNVSSSSRKGSSRSKSSRNVSSSSRKGSSSSRRSSGSRHDRYSTASAYIAEGSSKRGSSKKASSRSSSSSSCSSSSSSRRFKREPELGNSPPARRGQGHEGGSGSPWPSPHSTAAVAAAAAAAAAASKATFGRLRAAKTPAPSSYNKLKEVERPR